MDRHDLPSIGKFGRQISRGSASRSVRLWLDKAVFEETALEPRKAESEYVVLALCTNLTVGQNTVSPVALRPLIGPGISDSELNRWADQKSIFVTLIWSLDAKGSRFTTYHLLVPHDPKTGAHSIVFFGNLDGAFVFRNYTANFNKEKEAREAAIAIATTSTASTAVTVFRASEPFGYLSPTPHRGSSQNSSGSTSPVLTPRDRSRSLVRSWSPSCDRYRHRRSSSPRSVGPGAGLGTASRVTRPADRGQQRRRFQSSQHRLVEAYKDYANDAFRSTGNPALVQKALELSRDMAASQLQDLQLYPQQGGNDELWLEKA